MITGITYGKYFYIFKFDDYYDIYFSILGEDWEDYDITKEEDRSKITAILSDNLIQYISEIYDELDCAEEEDLEDMDSFWKGWNDFLDYMSDKEIQYKQV